MVLAILSFSLKSDFSMHLCHFCKKLLTMNLAECKKFYSMNTKIIYSVYIYIEREWRFFQYYYFQCGVKEFSL